MVKTPAFLTSAAAMVAKLLRIFVACVFLTSAPVASASARAPLVMTTAFMAGAIF